MFGNDMHLNEAQMAFLDHYCDGIEEITTGVSKFYVHKMNNSNVIPKKCKMVRPFNIDIYIDCKIALCIPSAK